MGSMFYHSGNPSGYQNEKQNNKREVTERANQIQKIQERDVDLIIDDNTVYEIDRECYERLNRQKRKR